MNQYKDELIQIENQAAKKKQTPSQIIPVPDDFKHKSGFFFGGKQTYADWTSQICYLLVVVSLVIVWF